MLCTHWTQRLDIRNLALYKRRNLFPSSILQLTDLFTQRIHLWIDVVTSEKAERICNIRTQPFFWIRLLVSLKGYPFRNFRYSMFDAPRRESVLNVNANFRSSTWLCEAHSFHFDPYLSSFQLSRMINVWGLTRHRKTTSMAHTDWFCGSFSLLLFMRRRSRMRLALFCTWHLLREIRSLLFRSWSYLLTFYAHYSEFVVSYRIHR